VDNLRFYDRGAELAALEKAFSTTGSEMMGFTEGSFCWPVGEVVVVALGGKVFMQYCVSLCAVNMCGE
jgi:hypothetical protein